jgi:hypothetical protein
LLAAFVWGLEQVAVAPLETGEIYPPYSTLRSDPLGAKALYESLALLPGISVERLYQSRAALHDPDAAMLVLGTDPVAWSALKEKTFEEYEDLIRSGGRLVIAFVPVPPPTRPTGLQLVDERWHVKLQYRRPSDADRAAGAIPRRSALSFEPGSEWRVLARRDDLPSAVERAFGAGGIVLVADSYPLSNEGLREDRNAALISRIVGPARRLLFDENHFGVVETGSVAKLMRKYRLEGAVAVLGLVAALFLWQSASSLLPPREIPGAAVVAGRDSLEGLAALLHRGIPEPNLVDACVAEWTKTHPRDARAARVEQAVAAAKGDAVARYRAVCRILTEKT